MSTLERTRQGQTRANHLQQLAEYAMLALVDGPQMSLVYLEKRCARAAGDLTPGHGDLAVEEAISWR